MLYFHQQGLVFLEVPKTGSSAVVEALVDNASMAIRRPPAMRHMNAGWFRNRARPFIEKNWGAAPETFAIMREPVDRLVSWYRYLQRDEAPGGPSSTVGVPFEHFITSVIGNAGPFKWIGRQDRFLMGNGKELMVNHLFRYDRPQVLSAFLAERFKREISLGRVNVSEAEPVEVPDALRTAILKARPREARLWKQLAREDYVHTPDA